MDNYEKKVKKNCRIHRCSSVNNFFLFVLWKKRKYESDADFYEVFENHHHLSDLLTQLSDFS